MTTNYERIKNMSIDEMAEFLKCTDCYYCPASDCAIWADKEEDTKENCHKQMIQWLQSKAKRRE